MYTDSHNHTSHFSTDARMTAAELMSAAKRIGLDAVVITEHYEKDYPHEMHSVMLFDVDAYFESFRDWKNQAPDGLTLYSGIELGYQAHLSKFYDHLVSSYPFDSVILSNHLYMGQDPYFYRACYDNPKAQVYANYIDKQTEMIQTCDEFDIVGHFDYIVRYSSYEDPKMRYSDSPESFDQFLKAIVQKKKSLEINTRSIDKLKAKGIEDCWPDRKILERYIELGGERVTLGSDSHDPSTLGLYFKETAEYLKSCGFRELTTYIDRKEIRTPIL